jgi:hypothetical protein
MATDSHFSLLVYPVFARIRLTMSLQNKSVIALGQRQRKP